MCDIVCDIVCVCMCDVVCVCVRARACVCPQVSSAHLKSSLAAARDGLPGDPDKDHPLRELSASEVQDAIELLDNCGLLIRKDGAMTHEKELEREPAREKERARERERGRHCVRVFQRAATIVLFLCVSVRVCVFLCEHAGLHIRKGGAVCV
jgi:hypothetical protein